MPRKANGSIIERGGRKYARIRVASQKQILVPLPVCTSLEAAQSRKAIILELVARLREHQADADTVKRLVVLAGASSEDELPALLGTADALCSRQPEYHQAQPKPNDITFSELGERWTSGELAKDHSDHIRRKKTAAFDRWRLEKHVYPHVGEVQVVKFALDDAQRVMRHLSRAPSAAATRRQVAQLMVRILNMAVFPLRLIAANPIPRGFLPKLPRVIARGYLYPEEDARLLACIDVPLSYRVLYGFLAREGMRCGEAFRLVLADFDLERGAVALDQNKTDEPRAWALSVGVVKALRAWVRLREAALGSHLPESAPMFTNLSGDRIKDTHLANCFRKHLRLAGVDRPELYEGSAVRLRIRVHDLRGTFVTLALANGASETWVMDRTGHKSSRMINRYRRIARTVEELRVGPLAPLHLAIPELSGETAWTQRGRTGKKAGAAGIVVVER